MQTDLSDGVRHLVSQGIVDPKRVSILGASYGGYAALAGATIDTGVYNCAVSIAGISNVRRMVNSDAEYSAEGRSSQMVLQTRRYLGEAGDYDDISPAQQAKKMRRFRSICSMVRTIPWCRSSRANLWPQR